MRTFNSNDEALEYMRNYLSDEDIEMSVHTTRALRVLDAIAEVGGINDKDAIVDSICRDLVAIVGNNMSRDFVVGIVEVYIPFLKSDGYITEDGSLTELGQETTEEHQMMLSKWSTKN